MGWFDKIVSKPAWKFIIGTIAIFTFFGITGGDLINKLMNYEWIISATKWSLIFGAFIFSVSAYYRPKYRNVILDDASSVDKGSMILRDIAIGVSEPDIAKWSLDGTHFSAVPTNDFWHQWFHRKWIINDLKQKDLDDFNFGEKYYLFDLIMQNKINIPTGIDVRDQKISDIIKPGMVLMLRKYNRTT